MKSTEEEEEEEEEETRGMKSLHARGSREAALCEALMRSRRRSDKRSQRANRASANRCDTWSEMNE